MKLYLGSLRISRPEQLEALAGIPMENINVAIIANSKDMRSEKSRAVSVRLIHKFLGKLGMATTEVDLNDLSTPPEVQTALADCDMVYVAGGNTFVLRNAMRRSRFDEAIYPLMENGLIYCGESAGSVVVGRTLSGVEAVDNVHEVDEPIFEGLGLIDRIIVPHANRRLYAGYLYQMRSTYKQDDLLILNDNEAFIVND